MATATVEKNDHKELVREFKELTDTPAHIRKWIAEENKEIREQASLDDGEEVPSGRHHAEKVLELLEKKQSDWNDEDFTFAQRVVSYAKRSAGISRQHGHNDKKEIGDSGLTKNEIARRNWGLPATGA